MRKKKYSYYFGDGKAEGRGNWKDRLGGKGAGLAEMTHLGINVPSGFTITTVACVEYFHRRKKFPAGMWEQALKHLKRVERSMGTRFGDPENPLLVSVRSGAQASMPGMMDTVLNLGLNDQTVQGLARRTHNSRFALDAYRRFIAMFGTIVLGVKRERNFTLPDGKVQKKNLFDGLFEEKKQKKGVQNDTDLDEKDLEELVGQFKRLIRQETGSPLPDDPYRQLRLAIEAVFNSWYGERAVTYRKFSGIPEDWGTAVNVQAMVFGNQGINSATGVAFTRDANTGRRRFFGEFLFNAQGEDVVAGIRTPLPIAAMARRLPVVYRELQKIYKKLERHYRDMLDLEFTVQEGKLYMLQTRVGKRTAAAAVRIAVEMAQEGLINRETAVQRVDPHQLDQLLHPTIAPMAVLKVIAKGLAASPGAAVGKVVFTSADAQRMSEMGERVVLVRAETSPEDIGGMHASQGILTARGGMTSHAAVVGRGMGKPCVVGCSEIQIDEEKYLFTASGHTIREGQIITLNGTTGDVILGDVPLIEPTLGKDFKTLMGWMDKIRQLKIRANADTPEDAKVARKFGAEGIGLCRTEHMFFEGDRIMAVREMILAEDEKGRKRALAKLLPIQRGDFIGIFREMKGLPVTIRLLDPPLHEFLPQTKAELEELARTMNVELSVLKAKNRSLQEFNPMLGHRGCRLGITYPEVYEMQVQAMMEAACHLTRQGVRVFPEVMIPLVVDVKELELLKTRLTDIAQQVMRRTRTRVRYLFGTMIELPRAILVADQIAREAEFFSFGTNDLTQTVYGLSRDDAGKFLPDYIEQGIFQEDPFVTIDRAAVGPMMEMGIRKGRLVRPNLKIGICGEHGGEPRSVEYCHQLGLDYVSCSPYRVPIARLAAAQAALRHRRRRSRKK